MKYLNVLLVVLFMTVLVLPACAPAAPDCTSEEVFCVGLVTDIGKINDRSFNQSCWEGLQRAREELGARIEYIETADARDHSKNIATFAEEGFDVIVTCGFDVAEATTAAAELYPETDFIGVDQFQTESQEGLAGLIFPEDQAGFVVGALAAMMSETHKIGAVCGPDSVPPVWRLGEGYKAGAAYADEIIGTPTEVVVVYHENDSQAFLDPEWGAEIAQSMVDEGADVVFGCGGLTGNGAIIAAAQADAYVIGVDTDQYLTLPEAAPLMLSSAVKLITPGLFELIRLAKDKQLPSGNYFGDAGYAPFHDMEPEIPVEVKANLEQIYAGLLDGSIRTNVPSVKP